VREDAPESLRYFVLNKAEELGLRPGAFRDIACSVLEQRPDPSNWSAYPNIWDEVQGHVYRCPWFQVYDIKKPAPDQIGARPPSIMKRSSSRIGIRRRVLGRTSVRGGPVDGLRMAAKGRTSAFENRRRTHRATNVKAYVFWRIWSDLPICAIFCVKKTVL
jgi:hypothetical protein